jgi:hypothetical protein
MVPGSHEDMRDKGLRATGCAFSEAKGAEDRLASERLFCFCSGFCFVSVFLNQAGLAAGSWKS